MSGDFLTPEAPARPRAPRARLSHWLDGQLAPLPSDVARAALWYLYAALAFSALFGLEFTYAAFSGEWVAPLDAHQHVYWMRRFEDPAHFPGDPHTDYFQAVAPMGYVALYWALWGLGASPLVVCKLLPMALGLIGTGFTFKVAMRVFPVPLAAFTGALLATQITWMHGDLTTGTPRAFHFPLLAIFIDRLLARDLRSLAAVMALTPLFYPPLALVEAAVVGLWPLTWHRGRPALTWEGLGPWGLATLAIAAGPGLALYAVQTAPFGPVAGAAEARLMAEFQEFGFRHFFVSSPWEYWFYSYASGYNHALKRLAFPWAMALGLLLPLAWAVGPRPRLLDRVTPELAGLGKVLAAVTALFLVSHATLFALYLPGRHAATASSLVLAVAAGIVLAVGGAALVEGAASRPRLARLARLAVLAAFLGVVATSFTIKKLPNIGVLRRGTSPDLYEFLARQPKDVLVASLSPEMENVPLFAGRKVLVSPTLNPYHLGYYRPFRKALIALAAAQYSARLEDVAAFLSAYDVDLLVVDRDAFKPDYVKQHYWLRPLESQVNALCARLAGAGPAPALMRPAPKWIVHDGAAQIVFDAHAIIVAARPAADVRRGP